MCEQAERDDQLMFAAIMARMAISDLIDIEREHIANAEALGLVFDIEG